MKYLLLLTLSLTLSAHAITDDDYKTARKAIRLAKEVEKKDFNSCNSLAVNALNTLNERDVDSLEDCVKLSRKESGLIKDLAKTKAKLKR